MGFDDKSAKVNIETSKQIGMPYILNTTYQGPRLLASFQGIMLYIYMVVILFM